ncbi:MAG: FAD-binding oxidoreductase, partial [Deltaproteobacteria bacterium]|nr:FAD-binding oxidoreductase [Deltaproteobacteria bacterium]
KVPVVTYGGGTSLRAATMPSTGAIVCDMKRMKRVTRMDENSMIVTAEAGILGEALQHELRLVGLTLGHFPPAFYGSTLGGFLATRSAGSLSTRYGPIEDMVISLQAVLPDGSIVKTRTAPRSATGPDFNHVFLGSQGTLGIITRASLRCRMAPATRTFAAYKFADWNDGVTAMRLMMRKGLLPAAVRYSDPPETARTFARMEDEPDGNVLVLVFEGHDRRALLEASIAAEIALSCHCTQLGEEAARHWFDHRFAEAYRRSPVLAEDGAYMEVIDTAATWSRLPTLIASLRDALAGEGRQVSLYVANASSVGASVCLTVQGHTPAGEEGKTLQAIWTAALSTIRQGGGTVSYRQGIGPWQIDALKEELGVGYDLLRDMKRQIDPNGIMNPGAFGFDRTS